MAGRFDLSQVQGAGQTGTLSFDMLNRVSLVLGIYKALHILYPQAELADQWINFATQTRSWAASRRSS